MIFSNSTDCFGSLFLFWVKKLKEMYLKTNKEKKYIHLSKIKPSIKVNTVENDEEDINLFIDELMRTNKCF